MLIAQQLKQFLHHAVSYRRSLTVRKVSLRLLAESALSTTDLKQILGDTAGMDDVERQYLFGLFCLAGRPDAVQQMLHDSSNQVRIAAQVALEKTGNREKQSLTQEKDFRYMIFDKLFGIPTSDVEEHCSGGGMDAHIIETLFLGDPDDELGVATLIDLSAHIDKGVSVLAERVLRKKGETAADRLVEALPRLPVNSAESVFTLLSERKDKRLLDHVSYNFDQGNFRLPSRGAAIIASFGDQLAVRLLLKLLENASPDSAKQEAHAAITQMGPAAIDPLRSAYSDDLWFRRSQGELFAEVAGISSLRQLLEGVRDSLRIVRDSAEAGLTRLGQAAAPKVQELLNDSDPDIRMRGVRLLGQIGDESSAAVVSKHVTKGTRQERLSAVRALSLLWSSKTLNTLSEGLKSSDWRVREAAALAIENAPGKESQQAIDLLKIGLADRVSDVRRASLFALYAQGRKNDNELPVIHRLISNLASEQDPEISRLAQDILGEMQGMKSVFVDKIRKSRIEHWLDSFFGLHSPDWTPEPVPEPSTGIKDNVHFSVTAPRMISPGTALVIDVWAHIDRWSQYVRPHGSLRDCYDWVVQTVGPACVSSGAILRVVMEIPDFGIVEFSTMSWFGVISNCNFALEVPEDADLRAYRGAAGVYVGDMQVTRVSFLIQVGLKVDDSTEDVTSRETKVDTAFASYSSKDKKDVLAIIQGMLTVLPDLDVFLDAKSFRSGEAWQERIEEEIAFRNLFYLFWSCAARESTWVQWEWRTAVRIKAMEQIVPVPLESPSKCPPPAELAKLHFDDWTLVYRQASR